MIQLVVLYIICVGCFAIFVIAGRYLISLSDGEVTQGERILHSLKLTGFIMCLGNAAFLLLLETMFLSIGRYDDFINDVFSPSGFLVQGINVVMFLVFGFVMDPRAGYAPERERWSLLLIILIIAAGILGIVIGVLI